MGMARSEMDISRDGSGGSAEVTFHRLGRNELSGDVLTQLEALYASAYYGSEMFEALLDDAQEAPAIFQLFLATLETGRIVGARAIELKPHSFFAYHGHRPVHGKRFCVAPEFRSQGIGKRLIAEGRHYCFEELELEVLFGESNEVGALAMHGREGALFSLESIELHSPRNHPKENLAYLTEFITDPRFRKFRLPIGEGVQFVHGRDEEVVADFRERGYRSAAELLEEVRSGSA